MIFLCKWPDRQRKKRGFRSQPLRPAWVSSLALAILITTLLASCSRAPTSSPSSTFPATVVESETSTLTPTSPVLTEPAGSSSGDNPGPEEQDLQGTDIYPAPGVEPGASTAAPGDIATSVYPGPEAGSSSPDANQPVLSTDVSPAPGSGSTAQATAGDAPPVPLATSASATPAPGDPYPGPGAEATALPDAQTPAATTPPPAAAPPTSPSPTAGSPVPAATALPTIDPKLRATDPRKVKLASGKLQFIEFFAFWGGASQEMAAIVHRLEAQYGDRVNFVYLDVDDPATEKFKKALHYRSHPHHLLLDEEGEVLMEWLGKAPLEKFERVILEALG